ncbi:hypothetical protein QYE76_071698 [Lolium multiflorum]|uniref:FBD domain-containing protein n=1 Tax=Lolium multiflorum TaxID=4521 RepID=A0AAD8SM04_LOLMU|nr:hypothetical protein QYE76_071698 [Lolium multiflorum]
MKDRCTPLVNCSCDEPKDWRTQTISLTNLEKVEIKQFNGQDHEFDFLKLIFRCAPMLTRVALELTEGFTSDDGWCTEIHNIFMVYPCVECTVDYIVQFSGRSRWVEGWGRPTLRFSPVHMVDPPQAKLFVNMTLVIRFADS